MAEWITVKDRLPETNRTVLVYMPELFNNIRTAFYARYWSENDEDWHEGWSTNMTVTHWMPLPEPPEEEDENG